ncbi:MAG: transposase [bacterium]|nr:transposase [bacterium]
MPRLYRLQAKELLYHVISRGDDRKKIFVNDRDCEKFLQYLANAKEKFNFYLYAYCLMENHYHLLLETPQANISKIMQHINTSYAVYHNTKWKRCGHLFQGRYKSVIVDADNYLLELTRYIHLNPVKANIQDSPEKYKWSSYNEYANDVKRGLIDKEILQKYCKMPMAEYRNFVLETLDNEINPLNKVHAGLILGDERFIKDTFCKLKTQIQSKDFAYKKKISAIDPEILINRVAVYYGKNPEYLKKAKKRPLLAKKIAVYLLKRFTDMTNECIGNKFQISYSAVSKINKDVIEIMERSEDVKAEVAELISHFKV